MDYDLIVVKTLERVYKNYYYIIRGKVKENYRAFRLIGLGLAAERQIGYADGVLNLTTDEYEITELGRIFLKYMKE